MSEKEIRSEIDAVKGSLTRIESAIVGDPGIGLPGLVSRVSAAEETLKKYDAIKNKVIGAAIVVSAGSAIVGHYTTELLKYILK
jgi:hypothetical protein